mmetsp:Transcript_31276/g.69620  ORF Transcript_31276/g.69620 Transcript_31276/m.69620 type:complete len:260 (-) Transcript_31276:734-1513(-)
MSWPSCLSTSRPWTHWAPSPLTSAWHEGWTTTRGSSMRLCCRVPTWVLSLPAGATTSWWACSAARMCPRWACPSALSVCLPSWRLTSRSGPRRRVSRCGRQRRRCWWRPLATTCRSSACSWRHSCGVRASRRSLATSLTPRWATSSTMHSRRRSPSWCCLEMTSCPRGWSRSRILTPRLRTWCQPTSWWRTSGRDWLASGQRRQQVGGQQHQRLRPPPLRLSLAERCWSGLAHKVFGCMARLCIFRAMFATGLPGLPQA